MLLHIFTNILVKKFIGNNLVLKFVKYLIKGPYYTATYLGIVPHDVQLVVPENGWVFVDMPHCEIQGRHHPSAKVRPSRAGFHLKTFRNIFE